jgi:hypothetical protein
VTLCSAEEVFYFTQRHDFFQLVLNAPEVPSDDLLAAALRYASLVYTDAGERYEFMVKCGRHIARLLANDLKRLSHLLALIRPYNADTLISSRPSAVRRPSRMVILSYNQALYSPLELAEVFIKTGN